MISRVETGPGVQRRIKTGRVVTRWDQSCTNVASRDKSYQDGARLDASRPVPTHVCTHLRHCIIMCPAAPAIASQAATSVYLMLLLQC